MLSIDRTTEAIELERNYVESETLSEIVRVLPPGGGTVVVTGNAGIGKRAACLVALRRTLAAPIFELPADLGFDDIIASIRELTDDVGNACFVMVNADAGFVGTLDEFQLEEIRKRLCVPDPSYLMITTQGGLSRHRTSLTVLNAKSMSPALLVNAYFGRFPADPSTVVRVRAVAEASEVFSFAILESVMSRLNDDPEVSESELLQGLAGDSASAALDEWFNHDRTAREVAALACVATCEFGPRADLDEQVLLLEQSLLGDNVAPTGPPMFGRSAGDTVAKGMVTTTSVLLHTHFGVHQESVYVLEKHVDRVQVIQYLWAHAGTPFRRAYQDWLTALCRHRSRILRSGASVAAGVLLAVDPRYVESALIRPWAKGSAVLPTLAAGRALGVPTILNLASDVGHQLAKSWISTRDRDLRFCAVVAYGGPLGAWDLSSAAPVRLWRVACEEDDLSGLAGRCLADLCAAGPEAGHIRLAVFGLLADEASGRLSVGRAGPGKALRIFGLSVAALFRKSERERTSLYSLLGGGEVAAKAAFDRLLARTLSTRFGARAADMSVRALVRAADEHVISTDVLVELIRAAKREAIALDRIVAFGAGLHRALRVERRARPNGSAVNRLLSQFFPTP